ncbi:MULTISPECIES: multifunctional CCA tRNA nucleotidyl transferase/2'3'-cyclic phosphodiesterase/2'nucleotidase/phosphatase [Candidatus Ichthyocystis]|uniref:multifunctional CCA tRNA nucleotidyl transferase/2'3'-cyclic phosphodiesterase/2'nucleotidase/phosphatase n=1 Tax=Candidatus Ichthyocystis TaxID=2929841 RepID=UPI000A5E03F3|nr:MULTISPECIES: multifunctional CCA tRNA nucleotidyl transferase/2'3'-cyclic phosphodiesterase/2'nucleotidase/phosphatase [Ichthyocystis]
MRCYIVGGAVRDFIMGISPEDRDWAVVGSSVEEMLSLGFIPVGRDFPVFLHPETKEEYALARTERKFGKGYKGFTICAEPNVSLEQDLMRRDLTINAIAMDEEGNIFDPFGGVSDIKNKILRHVSSAFSEDPLRVLRLSRFSARYPEFNVHPDTMELSRLMVQNGELNTLVEERVWQELSKGLAAPSPHKMFSFLFLCNAFFEIFKEFKYITKDSDSISLFFSSSSDAVRDLAVPERFAYYFAEFLNIETLCSMCTRMKIPVIFRRLGMIWRRCLESSCTPPTTSSDIVEWFDTLDLWRCPDKFSSVSKIIASRMSTSTSVLDTLKTAFDASRTVKLLPHEIALLSVKEIKDLLKRKRIIAVSSAIY